MRTQFAMQGSTIYNNAANGGCAYQHGRDNEYCFNNYITAILFYSSNMLHQYFLLSAYLAILIFRNVLKKHGINSCQKETIMKPTKTAIVLIIIGLLLLGMSAQAMFFSGNDIKEFPLKSRDGHTEFISLQPAMNPLRLLIAVNLGAKVLSTAQRHIEYVITAKTREGELLWVENGHVSVHNDNKIIGDQTHYISLQTYTIETPTEVQFIYQFKEANLRYKGASLTLKRNVTRHQWSQTIAGLILLLAGILIFASNQKRKNTLEQ